MPPLVPGRRERIKELWDQQASLLEIAEALETSTATIGNTMSRMRQEGWDLSYRRGDGCPRDRVRGDPLRAARREVTLTERSVLRIETVLREAREVHARALRSLEWAREREAARRRYAERSRVSPAVSAPPLAPVPVPLPVAEPAVPWKLPAAPFRAWLERQVTMYGIANVAATIGVSQKRISTIISGRYRSAGEWYQYNFVQLGTVDTYMIRMGDHPSQIYPDLY